MRPGRNPQPARLRRRAPRGAAIPYALMSLVFTILLCLLMLDYAQAVRMQTARLKQVGNLRLLAEAGLDYGYWRVRWQGASLPLNENSRTMGTGSVSVNVVNYSATLSNSIRITSTATIGDRSMTLVRAMPKP